MEERFINNIFQGVMIIFMLIVVYFLCLIGGVHIAVFSGLYEPDIYQLTASIIFSTGIMFLVTLQIHYVFQKVPFLNEDNLIRYYFGVHLALIYLSGLMATISVLEPLLIKEGLIKEQLNSEMFVGATFIFFILISNYNIYNTIVLDNKFEYFKIDMNKKIRISFINLILTFASIMGMATIIRFFKNGPSDEVTIIWTFILVGPIVISRIFKDSLKNIMNT